MFHASSWDSVPKFGHGQIVCLECGGTCLYAEVIQVVSARKMCWVRPLMLTLASGPEVAALESEAPPQQSGVWDLRGGSDLLWPLSLFRVALDTEVMPLLMELYSLDTQGKDAIAAHRQLRDFVGQVWKTYPDAFGEFKWRSDS